MRQVLAAGLPPTLELLSAPESQQRGREFTLEYKIVPKDGGIGRVVYRINGVVVGDLTSRPVDIGVPYHRRPFTLPPGRNVVNVTVFNGQNTVESTPVKTVVHVQPDERRPTLYVLALGVSNYRALQLRYAADDAKALVDTLRRQGQRLFTTVETSLLDRDVTLGNLEAAFRDLAGKVQAHDVFILYLAGQGMTLDGEYHFIPADVIYENAWQGAPFAHLQALPTDARPVTDWADRDQAFTNVAQGIRRAAQAIRHTATDAPIAHTLLAAPSDAHRR